MLSFKFITSAAGAAHYFESSDDYYGKEGHRGEWIGAGVALMGLTDSACVAPETLRQLLDGQLPEGQRTRLSRTRAGKDRKGIDFTFSAPKSVSIQALMLGDPRITAAHDAAVAESLQLLQTFAAARKKERGLSFRERTGVLIGAAFRHELSRAQDPQLHTHVLVMNLTRRADGEWRALSNEDLLRNVRMVGAFYRSTLAAKLRELGFDLRATSKGGWELAHVSDAAVRLFSQRSREIERLLSLGGRDREGASSAQKQALALASRPRKSESDRAWLRAQWLQIAREAGLDLAKQHRPDVEFRRLPRRLGMVLDTATQKRSVITAAADEAVGFAIAHLAERQGVFSRAELLEVAYGRAATAAPPGAVEGALDRARTDKRLVPELALFQTARSLNVSASELAKDPSAARFKVHDEFEKLSRSSWIALTMMARGQTEAQAERAVDAAIARGALVASEPRFATPEARRSELHVLSLERRGRGAVPSVASAPAVARLLAGSNLNAGQRDAVAMILSTHDRFVGVQGLAGTGKSHMLSKAVEGIKAEATRLSVLRGYKVVGLAPYASQNQALAALGMESQTLASLLARKSLQERLGSRSIVFLDEAGVVPAHQFEMLMSIIERQNARLVLTGDRHQTHAVEAGRPFEQLQDAGMTRAFLTEIQRQKSESLRTAVVHAARGEVPLAVARLQHSVVEARDDTRRHTLIADAYLRLAAEDRAETLIVSGTNEARRSINAKVRAGLGLQDNHQVNILDPVDMTRAELRSAQSYDVGQVVVPQRSYGTELFKGEQLRVLDVVHRPGHGTLIVQREDGTVLNFDPSKRSMLRVYHAETVDMATGDLVRVIANDKGLGVRNGERYRVAAIDDRHITLEGQGAVIRVDRSRAAYLQHAYASTVHSAQGLTSTRVLVDANTRSLSSNRAVFYVAISRAREEVTLFTEDASRLAVAMSREPKKFAALDLRDPQNEANLLKVRTQRLPQRTRTADAARHGPAAAPKPTLDGMQPSRAMH
ncbi:MobF family relaxase [Variovorax sp. RCC_210]|uniref:MobF family relaxase n=1 Tax=Variovorax sp. RCC_210 TaxID=3239217 RepID=UPI003523858C